MSSLSAWLDLVSWWKHLCVSMFGCFQGVSLRREDLLLRWVAPVGCKPRLNNTGKRRWAPDSSLSASWLWTPCDQPFTLLSLCLPYYSPSSPEAAGILSLLNWCRSWTWQQQSGKATNSSEDVTTLRVSPELTGQPFVVSSIPEAGSEICNPNSFPNRDYESEKCRFCSCIIWGVHLVVEVRGQPWGCSLISTLFRQGLLLLHCGHQITMSIYFWGSSGLGLPSS